MNMNMRSNEPTRQLNLFRGIGWLLVAIIGAWLIGSGFLARVGVNEYTARWLGVCFKAASAIWAGYRVSRDVLKIDPSLAITGSVPFAVLHCARALVICAFVLAVTQGV